MTGSVPSNRGGDQASDSREIEENRRDFTWLPGPTDAPAGEDGLDWLLPAFPMEPERP
jgi:hypothetical protein